MQSTGPIGSDFAIAFVRRLADANAGNNSAVAGRDHAKANPLKEISMSKETPKDDPRQKTDLPTHKQTDEPWRGNPEKDQVAPDRPKPDLEKWQRTNTH